MATSVDLSIQTFNQLEKLPRALGLTNVRKEMYKLNKEPTGLSLSDGIVGIDPVGLLRCL
ncbi:hypothetical protein RMATCC62417_16441 [Rhizopus microsporus]|nr:hypothetical protein RMATCC62417_16441 [Rhizopus microsporus]